MTLQTGQALASQLLKYSPWKAKFTRWGIHLEFGYLTGNIKSGPFRGEMSLWLGGNLRIWKMAAESKMAVANGRMISHLRNVLVFEKQYPSIKGTGKGTFDLYSAMMPTLLSGLDFDESDNSLFIELDNGHMIRSVPGGKGSLSCWSFIDRRNSEAKRFTFYKDAVECYDNEYPEEVLREWEIRGC
jgi:hypothetical protein